jgi:hypothetical protein
VINIIYLPTILNSNISVISSSDWPMVAANPQRISWNTKEVIGCKLDTSYRLKLIFLDSRMMNLPNGWISLRISRRLLLDPESGSRIVFKLV